MLRSCMSYYESCAAIEEDEKAWETDEEQNAADFVEVEISEAERPKAKARRRRQKIKKNNTAAEVRKSSRGLVPLNVQKNDYTWAPDEKRSLLEAVKKYGHLDLNRLCEAVPYKSESAIKSMIIKWWRRSAVIRQSEIDEKPIYDRRFMVYRTYIKKKSKGKKKPSKLAPIEQWLQELRKGGTIGNHTETKTVAKAMLFISLFEKHPDPAECDGIDFSALYDYLYRMLMGYPPKDFNEATKNYLLSVMDNLTAEIRNKNFHGEEFHLNSVRKISLTPTTVKEYGSSKREPNSKPIDMNEAYMRALLETPGYNPLSTPLHLLIRN